MFIFVFAHCYTYYKWWCLIIVIFDVLYMCLSVWVPICYFVLTTIGWPVAMGSQSSTSSLKHYFWLWGWHEAMPFTRQIGKEMSKHQKLWVNRLSRLDETYCEQACGSHLPCRLTEKNASVKSNHFSVCGANTASPDQRTFRWAVAQSKLAPQNLPCPKQSNYLNGTFITLGRTASWLFSCCRLMVSTALVLRLSPLG